jgi:hypothetical protein
MNKVIYNNNDLVCIVNDLILNNQIMFMYYSGSIAYGVAVNYPCLPCFYYTMYP